MVQRRAFLSGGVGAIAAALSSAEAVAAMTPTASRFLSFASPEEEFKAHFRFERDLKDAGEAFTWYQFTVFALPEGDKPAPIVRFEGMEYSYFRRVAPSTWLIQAHNLSFPRRVADGAFTSEVINPITEQTVAVPAMILLDDPGVLYGPKGYLPLDTKDGRWLAPYRLFRIQGDKVVVDHIRAAPANWPKTFIECSTTWADRAEYDNPAVTSLKCGLSGFYTFPFPAWMEMGDRPGRMLGSIFGQKLKGPDDLPVDFRDRVRREYPELLRPRRELLDKPLSDLAARALAG